MKTIRILLVVFLLLLLPKEMICQNHFKGSNYFDLSIGMTDQSTMIPSIGAGHDFNSWFSLNSRYAFTMPGRTYEYRFYHHSIDIFPKFVIHNFNDVWAINILTGFTQSLNYYSELPRPNFKPHIYNCGYIVGIEYENMINNNIAIFSSIINRGYLLDSRKHFEMSYQVGVRLNTGIFSTFFN